MRRVRSPAAFAKFRQELGVLPRAIGFPPGKKIALHVDVLYKHGVSSLVRSRNGGICTMWPKATRLTWAKDEHKPSPPFTIWEPYQQNRTTSSSGPHPLRRRHDRWRSTAPHPSSSTPPDGSQHSSNMSLYITISPSAQYHFLLGGQGLSDAREGLELRRYKLQE